MDKVIIKDACFPCRVGVSEEERKYGQTLFIDIIMQHDARPAAQSALIKDALDYTAVRAAVRELVTQREYHLIETVAEQIAQLIHEQFQVQEVCVLIKKPGAIKNTAYAAVKIVRTW